VDPPRRARAIQKAPHLTVGIIIVLVFRKANYLLPAQSTVFSIGATKIRSLSVFSEAIEPLRVRTAMTYRSKCSMPSELP